MLVMMREKWHKNEAKLQERIRDMVEEMIRKDSLWWEGFSYKSLVRLTFDLIVNGDESEACVFSDSRLNTKRITQIDDGDYQGTLLFTIPFDTYQPSEYEYLMTYINYGSCSVCDTLQAALAGSDVDTITKDLMYICRALVMNTIHPFNNPGQGYDFRFAQVKWED